MKIKFFISLITLVFLISFASAWYNNSFYDTGIYQTSKNITLSSTQNVSVNISIPSSINFLTTGRFNLTFGVGLQNLSTDRIMFSVPTNPNVVGAEVEIYNSSGKMTISNVTSSPTHPSITNLWDGLLSTSFDTFSTTPTNITIYLPKNYTIKNVTLIMFAGNGGTGVHNFNISLFDYNSNTWALMNYSFLNDTYRNFSLSYNNLATNSNFSVDLGGNGIDFNYPVINGSNPQNFYTTGQNIILKILDYLSTCSYVAGFCNIPLIFSSNMDNTRVQYSNINISNEGILENSQTYDTTAYETEQNVFSINATGMSSAVLNYKGVDYTASISADKATKILDIPLGSANNSFYWKLNGGTYNSTSTNQEVYGISFSICDLSITNYPYINFSYKDEISGTFLNGTAESSTWSYYLGGGSVVKTYTLANTTANPNYAFCFTPKSESVIASATYQYSSTGYPARTYYLSQTLTNTTTNKTLYLLASASGSYVSYAVQTATSAVLSGVVVVAYTQLSDGSYNLVGYGTTGSDGIVTFWLSPLSNQNLTFSKAGYTSVNLNHRPSQSLYTIVMSASSGGNASYVDSLAGIKYSISPKGSFLQRNTNYKFEFNVTASLGNLISSRLIVSLPNGTALINTSSSNAYSANLSGTINTLNYTSLKGYYYIDIGNSEVLIDPSLWIMENITQGSNSFLTAIQNLKNHSVNTEDNFAVLFFTFIIGSLLLSVLTFTTGLELANPASTMVGVCVGVIILSVAGFFSIDFSPSDWLDKYGIAVAYTCLTAGMAISRWRDS
jgi:hypothetical protein